MTDVDGLPVVVTDDYLAPGLDEYNTASLLTGRAWLLLKPVGPVMWLGPLLRPGVTGCWQCLAHRLWQHRAVEAYLQGRADRPRAGTRRARRRIRRTIARALAGIERDALEGLCSPAIWTRIAWTAINSCGGPTVLPVANRCGRIASSIRSSCSRVRRAFARTVDTERVTPEETWARFQHHVSPVTGIVTALERTPLDTGARCTFTGTGRNAALRPTTLGGLRAGAHSGSSAKA